MAVEDRSLVVDGAGSATHSKDTEMDTLRNKTRLDQLTRPLSSSAGSSFLIDDILVQRPKVKDAFKIYTGEYLIKAHLREAFK